MVSATKFPPLLLDGSTLETDDKNRTEITIERWFLTGILITNSFCSTVAWFTFDTISYPSETRLTADGLTVTTDSYEPRVLLSSVGFSRGVHYWEFTIERYDGTADPAFGIARRDISRDTMLGNLQETSIHHPSFNHIQIFSASTSFDSLIILFDLSFFIAVE